MGSSHPLVAVGVGILVAVSHTTAGYSQEHDSITGTAASTQSSSEALSEKISFQSNKLAASQSQPAIAHASQSNQLARSQPTVKKSKPNKSTIQKKAKDSTVSTSSTKQRSQQTAQADPAAPIQTTDPTPASGTTPASVIPTVPVTPTIPALPFQNQPIGPAKLGIPPEYLNPNPNPLSFPTRPEEVRLRGIQPITLQQALELAKRNNRDLRLRIEVLQRERAVLRQAQAARYPTIGANGQITQSRSASGQLSQAARTQAQQSFPPALQQDASGDQQSTLLNGTVQISYDIFTSGRRPAQIRAAEQQIRAEELTVEVTLQQLQLDVSNAYYELQRGDESVRIQQSAVRNAEAILRDVVAQERAGIGTRLDVLQQQVQLARSQQLLVTSLGTQQIRRRELAQLLAVPPYLNLAAADPVEVAGVWDMSLEQSIVTAFKNRAELERDLAGRAAAEQQKKAALASLGPTVAFNFQYNILNNLRDQLGFADGFSTSLGVQWNFFDGGAARAQASQQDANIAQAETNFAKFREQIQLQVETAYTNLGTNFLNIGTNRQAIEQAREALRLARLRFQAGVGTQTEVINTQNALTQAEGDFITAIIDYNRALASLTRFVTNLPIPAGSTTPTLPKTVTNSTIPGGNPAPLPR